MLYQSRGVRIVHAVVLMPTSQLTSLDGVTGLVMIRPSTQAGATMREEVGCTGRPLLPILRCKPQQDCCQTDRTWQLWLPPAKLCYCLYAMSSSTFSPVW